MEPISESHQLEVVEPISESHQLEVVFLPFLAPGHMTPMVDTARLFAFRGVKVTIITTTYNALRFKKSIEKDTQSGHHIAFHTLHLPSEQTDLPQGNENFTTVTSLTMAATLFHAMSDLQPSIEQYIKERRPDCIISDMFFPYTADLATSLGIPRIVFHVCGYFPLSSMVSMKLNAPHLGKDTFVIPDFPDEIQMLTSQLPEYVRNPSGYTLMLDGIREAEKRSYGVLVNSFDELEPAYAEYYTNVTASKAWSIGPLHISIKRTDADKAERGNEAGVDEHSCLSWLDSKEANSVLYVSFGSLTHFNSAQLLEVASGLEASGHPFIWVVRKEEETSEGDERWLPDGFKERVIQGKKGLIITGWAPQMLILDHPAIGGFITHCGWNSTIESVTAGVPMITWPQSSEQFYSEKLVTKVLKIGVEVGVEEWYQLIQSKSYFVTRDKIENAVMQLMGNGEEAVEMRRRARELGEKAKRAVEEGGSSYTNITDLIDKLKAMCSPI